MAKMTVSEDREDLIQAYRHRVIDAVNNDPNWDIRYYPTKNTASRALTIHLMHHTAAHHKKIVKNLTKIVNDICGPVDPVQATIDVKGPVATIKFSVVGVNESKEQLLVTLLHELVTSFQYAEESHYQDNGKVPPYTLKVSNGAGKVTVDMKMQNNVDFTKATHRMMKFIHEFFDEHILKPRVEATRTFGSATFHFYFDKLKEAMEPNDLAMKIAEKLVDLIRAEIKERAANAARIELTRFNNGIPCIRAHLANRSQLTRAGVQRIIKDVCDRELPPGNLLKLEPRYGGFGTASAGSSIAAAIKPV